MWEPQCLTRLQGSMAFTEIDLPVSGYHTVTDIMASPHLGRVTDHCSIDFSTLDHALISN
jgi:hypothetical protein